MRVGRDGPKAQTAGVDGLLSRPAVPGIEEACERCKVNEFMTVTSDELYQTGQESILALLVEKTRQTISLG